MLTETEARFVSELESIGAFGVANRVRQKALVRLAHDLGIAHILKDPDK